MRRFKILSLLLAGLAFMACTSVYQVRGTEQILEPMDLDDLIGNSEEELARQISMEHQSVERYTDFTLGVIEINDEGAVNPAQRAQVMQMVKEETRNGGTLVVFVHGWHHGARVCDRDIACFRAVLSELKRQQREQEPERASTEKVVGVYLGWRGESLPYRGVNLATIWGRKRVAEHIGRTAGKEILIELHDLWTGIDNLTMVTVGHSLGGALVYSAVKGKLTGNVSDIELGKVRTYRVPRTEKDREEALRRKVKALRAGFGDLVVLVNPALEANEYWPFDNDLKDGGKPNACNPVEDPKKCRDALVREKLPYDKPHPYDRRQLPILMTVASREDTAVGNIFPFARGIGALGTLRWRYLVSDAHLEGLGRHTPQITHQLDYPVIPQRSVEKGTMSGGCGCSKITGKIDEVDIQGELDLESVELRSYGKLIFGPVGDRLERGWDPNSPYLVVTATKGVISEHSDIFNPVFVGFLTRFINAYDRKQEHYAIADDIARIQAVDGRFHGIPAPRSSRERRTPAIGEPLFPQSLQPGHGEYVEAWHALYGATEGEVENDYVRAEIKKRETEERGASYVPWVLDQVGIELALVDEPLFHPELPRSRFFWVAPADLLINPFNRSGGIDDLLKRLGESRLPASLEEYSSQILRGTLNRFKSEGAVAVKLTAFPPQRGAADPERIYRALASGGAPSEAETQELKAFLAHRVAREAGRLGLVVHVPTTDPRQLAPFVGDPELQGTRFVLIPGGSPSRGELESLLRGIGDLLERPNVYAELSPRILELPVRVHGPVVRDWLERHPDKILFGSDANADSKVALGGWEERQWLFTKSARSALGATLGVLLEEDKITRERAVDLARMVLRDNAISLYKLAADSRR